MQNTKTTEMYRRGDDAEIARHELREALDQQQVVVSEDEFEAFLAEQTDMRAKQSALVRSMDAGELSPEGYLDALEEITSTSLGRTKVLMGADRYRAFFDTDETQNTLPVDRELFLSQFQAGSSTLRD